MEARKWEKKLLVANLFPLSQVLEKPGRELGTPTRSLAGPVEPLTVGGLARTTSLEHLMQKHQAEPTGCVLLPPTKAVTGESRECSKVVAERSQTQILVHSFIHSFTLSFTRQTFLLRKNRFPES